MLSCVKDDTRYTTLQGMIFGTSYSIKYLAHPHTLPSQEIHNEIKERLNSIDLVMSTWKENSDISALNNNDVGVELHASKELIDILVLSKELHSATQGAFDITVGPLVNLWGFGPNNVPDRVPSHTEITSTRVKTGIHNLIIDSTNNIVSKNTPLYLTLAAIAKGYAVDEVGKILAKVGIADYLVEIGGEIRAAGSRNNRKYGKEVGWRIAIEQPDEQGRSAHRVILLSNLGMATSGDYRNYYERNNKRYSHIIDPLTAYPVTHRLASVSVIHKNTAVADAWATALFVLGTEKGIALAEEQNIAAYFITRSDDAAEKFLIRETTEFTKIIHPIN